MQQLDEAGRHDDPPRAAIRDSKRSQRSDPSGPRRKSPSVPRIGPSRTNSRSGAENATGAGGGGGGGGASAFGKPTLYVIARTSAPSSRRSSCSARFEA